MGVLESNALALEVFPDGRYIRKDLYWTAASVLTRD